MGVVKVATIDRIAIPYYNVWVGIMVVYFGVALITAGMGILRR